MLRASLHRHDLKFAFPAGTSRGVLHEKPTWFIQVRYDKMPGAIGTGECSPIWGLSPEKENEYADLLENVVSNINGFEQLMREDLLPYPSVYFGLETAMMDLFKGGRKIFFENSFTEGKKGISINGLVWMNTIDEMYNQAIAKKKEGYTCIKLKIGSLNIDEEINLLQALRKELGKDIVLRVDANGAFDYATALNLLPLLKEINIHSIEQPIKDGNIDQMRELCAKKIVPIALDEELIGIYQVAAKENLIRTIRPQFVVLKPSLHGGFLGSRQWIEAAEKHNCGWWMTSALESNIGLNAIAQFTAQSKNPLPQGLGTGKIYTNNISSPLYIANGELKYNPTQTWQPNEF